MGFFGMLYDMFRDEEDEQFEEMMLDNLVRMYLTEGVSRRGKRTSWRRYSRSCWA